MDLPANKKENSVRKNMATCFPDWRKCSCPQPSSTHNRFLTYPFLKYICKNVKSFLCCSLLNPGTALDNSAPRDNSLDHLVGLEKPHTPPSPEGVVVPTAACVVAVSGAHGNRGTGWFGGNVNNGGENLPDGGNDHQRRGVAPGPETE